MKIGIALLGVAALAASASASSVTFSTSVASSTTNWATSVNLPQFDNGIGGVYEGYTLTGVTITLSGTATGNIAIESRDAAPASVSYAISANMNFTGPGGANGTAIPVAGGIFNASAYDGIDDFGGTSGASFTGLTGTNSASASPFVFGAYQGNGTIAISINAIGSSGGSGAGNLLQSFSTAASADASVTYTYLIPTPGAMALLGLGGIVAGRRRR